jgi:hypothetical protein
VVRSAAQDGEPGAVTVEQLAYGLAALDCNVWEDRGAVWCAMEQVERDGYLARARFVLGIAEDTLPSEVRGQVRWSREDWPDPLPPGAQDRRLRSAPVQAVVSLPTVERVGGELRMMQPARPHPVQVGDQRTVCTCGRWQFEDEPEPSKHIDGCPVMHLQGGPGQPGSAGW